MDDVDDGDDVDDCDDDVDDTVVWVSAVGNSTTQHRPIPSFRQNFSAPSCPVASSSIHRIMRLNRSREGSSSTGKLRAPEGREMEGKPVI